MRLKANDTMHISNVSAEPIQPGQRFTIEEGQGRQLVKRGLASEVAEAPKPKNENKGSVATETK